MKARDLTDAQFGFLTVQRLVGRNRNRKRIWECLCVCGSLKNISADDLARGTKSCGCYRKSGDGLVQHGASRRRAGQPHSRAYMSWENMRDRCRNPNNQQWKDYGGRGITVDPAWDDFAVFLADMGEPPPGKTLDRRDNNAGYSKANCRWATRAEQRRNARNVYWLVRDGRGQCLQDWCRELGLVYSAVLDRVHRGYSLEDATDASQWPNSGRGQAVSHTLKGETKSVNGWARSAGMSTGTLVYRLKQGMPLEQALIPPKGRGH